MAEQVDEVAKRNASLAREIASKRENEGAIQSSNIWVEKNGLPLAKHRRF